MAYRQYNPPKPEKRRKLAAASTPADMILANGTTIGFALPCYYIELHKPEHLHLHCRPQHDHLGWPNPRHPDRICQPCDNVLPDMIFQHDLLPIHLSEEGYSLTTRIIDRSTGDVAEYATAEAWIDEVEDWVARVRIGYDEFYLEQPKILLLDVFAAYANNDDPRKSGTALLGHFTVEVLPSTGYVSEEE